MSDTETDITERRARFALEQIATIDSREPTPYLVSMRAQHLRSLAEFEPVIRDYRTWLLDEISVRERFAASDPRSDRVWEALPGLRARLAETEQLLDAIKTCPAMAVTAGQPASA